MNWGGITIEKYQELCGVDSEGVSYKVDSLSIIKDIDSEIIRKLPLNEFFDMCEEISFINTPPNADMNRRFTIEGVEYGFIPDLDFITAGEWLDCEAWKDKPIENMHYYAALLYRPILHSRSEDDYDIDIHSPNGFMKRAELFKSLSVEKIYGAQLFFLIFALEYMNLTKDSLMEVLDLTETKTTKKKATPKATKKRK